MIIKKKLQDVYESIQAAKPRGFAFSPTDRNPLKGILPYALKSLIEEYPLLENEFKRRAFYYQNLAKDQTYLDVITGLHEQMKKIQKIIDPKKLPTAEQQRLNRPKHTPFDDEDGVDRFWIEMSELHSDLSKPDKWWYLGSEGMPYAVSDSIFAPWHQVLGQYEIVLGLMQQAFKSDALEDNEKNFEVYTRFKDSVQSLREIFEKPMHQLHVEDFEHLAHCMTAPEWMGDEEKDVERVKGYVDRVYKDLTLFLEEHEAVTSMGRKGKRRIIKYLGNGRLKYGQEEYILPKNVFYAQLSEKVYSLSQQVGHMIPCETLYSELKKQAFSRALHWRKIYDAVVKVNKWAARQKPKLPQLFSCSKEGVTRLV